MPPGGAGPVVLDVQGVRKAFHVGRRTVQALDDVSLQAPAGSVTGLIGPDAAGKTTLMRLVAGLLEADAGRIGVLGMDVASRPLDVQAAIGYMPQRFGLYEDLSVRQNLDLYADLQGVPPVERPDRYAELMHMTALGAFTGRLAGRLSGGMKQKLGLACTLVRRPELLLLDEPTVGVDPVSRRELWTIVYRLVEQGTSVLLSTSYLDEGQRCGQVILLHDGKVVAAGPPDSFSRRVAGRTYAVSVPRGMKRRAQDRLAGRKGVIDAVIQADRVRLVMDSDDPSAARALVGELPGASVEPAEPRLEDGFLALLRRGGAGQEAVPAAETPPAGGVQPADGQAVVIEVRDLQRSFGDFQAVRGVSFEVRAGEVFGLLGPNGAGKSTTFRMLCGLLPPSAGSLRVAGFDLRHAPAAARARIGYMSQKFSLYGLLSVRQNLSFYAGTYGLRGREKARRVRQAEEQFHLGGLGDAPSADLPPGYKQRLAMACALMHQPQVLFLDEPTSGVDPLARREFWRRINALAERGVTVLVTTHHLEEAEYCDRVAIMAAGRFLALDEPARIRSAAASERRPHPSMEDAFIALIEADEQGGGEP